ncbi:MAG: MotA/TolQ/ExbB proton channel family protein [Phycisphaeraceae bacterium]|nr:MAG: MotA/TolQ/ExbB proton channel family protein [Phycisphaeraceae bacterium]
MSLGLMGEILKRSLRFGRSSQIDPLLEERCLIGLKSWLEARRHQCQTSQAGKRLKCCVRCLSLPKRIDFFNICVELTLMLFFLPLHKDRSDMRPVLFLAQAESSRSLLQAVSDSGPVGTLLILLSMAAFALILVRLWQLRRVVLLPEQQLTELESLLHGGRTEEALAYCSAPSNDSFVTRALEPALARLSASPMAVFELRASIEEAGEVEVAALHRQTEPIAVIGAIAPLIGLLGTVLGMIGAFDALGAGAQSNQESIAGSISLALTTTLLGLVIAIPCVASVSWLRSRIDATAAEAGRELERLVLPLELGADAE